MFLIFNSRLLIRFQVDTKHFESRDVIPKVRRLLESRLRISNASNFIVVEDFIIVYMQKADLIYATLFEESRCRSEHLETLKVYIKAVEMALQEKVTEFDLLYKKAEVNIF